MRAERTCRVWYAQCNSITLNFVCLFFQHVTASQGPVLTPKRASPETDRYQHQILDGSAKWWAHRTCCFVGALYCRCPMVTNEGYGALAPQLGPLEHAPDPCSRVLSKTSSVSWRGYRSGESSIPILAPTEVHLFSPDPSSAPRTHTPSSPHTSPPSATATKAVADLMSLVWNRIPGFPRQGNL